MQTQKSTCLKKFCLLILVHAEITIAAYAAHSHTCKGIPGSYEKLGIEWFSKNLSGLYGLEDERSYKIMYFLCMVVKHFRIIKGQIFWGYFCFAFFMRVHFFFFEDFYCCFETTILGTFFSIFPSLSPYECRKHKIFLWHLSCSYFEWLQTEGNVFLR